MSDLALDLRDVCKTYGRGRRRVEALRSVSLSVRAGEVFGLLGPNGAGKSTLVKIMMTVVRPDRAHGTLLDQPLGSRKALARMGYLPEHHRFPRYLTGRQMLEFFGAMAGIARAQRRVRAQELLEVVGLQEAAGRRVDGYSKGMLQRLGVAQSLMNDPQLVVLDEPTDGVDPIGRQDIRRVLLRLRSEGRTVFLNSHLLSEVETVCDRVAIMVNGRVARQGTMAELSAHRQWYELEMPTADALVAREALAIGPDGKGQLDSGQWTDITAGTESATLRVGTSDPAIMQNILDRLRSRHCVILRMELTRPSLESLFMEAVREVNP